MALVNPVVGFASPCSTRDAKTNGWNEHRSFNKFIYRLVGWVKLPFKVSKHWKFNGQSRYQRIKSIKCVNQPCESVKDDSSYHFTQCRVPRLRHFSSILWIFWHSYRKYHPHFSYKHNKFGIKIKTKKKRSSIAKLKR